MKNTIGNAISVTLFGESHGAAVGAVVDGLAPGIKIDREYISKRMELRRASGALSTSRHEPDLVKILSGEFSGYTTGTPLTLVIENTNTKSGDYSELSVKPRPGHADYTAECKYHGYQDYRGGGHFSGRITAALVAAGAVISSALRERGIYIGTRIKRLGGVKDEGEIDSLDALIALEHSSFPALSQDAAEKMRSSAMAAAMAGDSVGGVLETVVYGMPAGVGEPWFDTVESVLSHILFSVPAVKGVEFGSGFAIADMRGSEANDAYRVKDGKIVTETNNNGGILGGITSGAPIVFRCAIKPTPSVFVKQKTVDISKMENTELELSGRHDATIVPRARAVIDAVTALALADLLTVRYGTDYLSKKDKL